MWMKSEKDKELKEGTIRSMPILVIKDMKSGYITSHVIPAKGVSVHGHGVKATINTLDFLGTRELC